MKHLLVLLISLASNYALSNSLEYKCENKNVDEDASYYLREYFVSVNSETKEAMFKNADGEMVSDGAINLKEFSSQDTRLIGGLAGIVWSDGGCRVEAFLTKEMLSGANKAKMKLKQTAECASSAIWFTCKK